MQEMQKKQQALAGGADAMELGDACIAAPFTYKF